MVEQMFVKHLVAGSNPAFGVFLQKKRLVL